MGNLLSRLNNQLNNNAVEETETTSNYKYPPKSGEFQNYSLFSLFFIVSIILNYYSGNFFSNSFIMGGERFDQAIPESYLFGENADLNWLGLKPIAVRNFNIDSSENMESFILFFSFHIYLQRTLNQLRHSKVL